MKRSIGLRIQASSITAGGSGWTDATKAQCLTGGGEGASSVRVLAPALIQARRISTSASDSGDRFSDMRWEPSSPITERMNVLSSAWPGSVANPSLTPSRPPQCRASTPPCSLVTPWQAAQCLAKIGFHVLEVVHEPSSSGREGRRQAEAREAGQRRSHGARPFKAKAVVRPSVAPKHKPIPTSSASRFSPIPSNRWRQRTERVRNGES